MRLYVVATDEASTSVQVFVLADVNGVHEDRWVFFLEQSLKLQHAF